jgi:hypothetical protein
MSKVCKWCGHEKQESDFYHCSNTKDKLQGHCIKCDNKRRADQRLKNHDREYQLARKRYLRDKAERNAYGRARHHERKLLIVKYYSNGTNRCACCGESHIEFLTIDHINGNGNKHRKELKLYGGKFYSWIIRNHFPMGYRVLCHNCNMALGLLGYCPHQRK